MSPGRIIRKKLLFCFLVLLPGVIALTPLSWVTPGQDEVEPFTFCLITNLTGYHCPGCGLTRAVFCVMHGKFSDAWAYNRLIVIVFPLIAGLWIAWLAKLGRELRKQTK